MSPGPSEPGSGARAAFGRASDGDLRGDPSARASLSARLGIPAAWATVHQVHGDRVVTVDRPGAHGDADGVVTRRRRLPLAVFTADCLGIVLLAEAAVGVAHAGWRGVAAGVVERTIERIESVSGAVERMVVGPHIGPCCFEVGPEVAARFPDATATTTWGTTSVDLAAEVERRTGMPLERRGGCTMCGDDAFSHRRARDSRRMAAIGWLP